MSHDNNSRLVYSTDGGMIKIHPRPNASPSPPTGSCASAARPKDGRAPGASIHGVPLPISRRPRHPAQEEVRHRRRPEGRIIEIQGTNGTWIKAELEKAGFQVKLVGG